MSLQNNVNWARQCSFQQPIETRLESLWLLWLPQIWRVILVVQRPKDCTEQAEHWVPHLDQDASSDFEIWPLNVHPESASTRFGAKCEATGLRSMFGNLRRRLGVARWVLCAVKHGNDLKQSARASTVWLLSSVPNHSALFLDSKPGFLLQRSTVELTFALQHRL